MMDRKLCERILCPQIFLFYTITLCGLTLRVDIKICVTSKYKIFNHSYVGVLGFYNTCAVVI
jgi:hypothetical protein